MGALEEKIFWEDLFSFFFYFQINTQKILDFRQRVFEKGLEKRFL